MQDDVPGTGLCCVLDCAWLLRQLKVDVQELPRDRVALDDVNDDRVGCAFDVERERISLRDGAEDLLEVALIDLNSCRFYPFAVKVGG